MTDENNIPPQRTYLLSIGKRHKDLNKEELRKYNGICNKHRYKKLKSGTDKQALARFNRINRESYERRDKEAEKVSGAAYRKSKRANDHDGRYRLKQWFFNLRTRAGLRAEPEELLGCTLEEFRDHIMSLWTEDMSWDNYGKARGREAWQIDHIEEIHAGGGHHYTNLQPLWQIDNIHKHWGKTPLHI